MHRYVLTSIVLQNNDKKKLLVLYTDLISFVPSTFNSIVKINHIDWKITMIFCIQRSLYKHQLGYRFFLYICKAKISDASSYVDCDLVFTQWHHVIRSKSVEREDSIGVQRPLSNVYPMRHWNNTSLFNLYIFLLVRCSAKCYVPFSVHVFIGGDFVRIASIFCIIEYLFCDAFSRQNPAWPSPIISSVWNISLFRRSFNISLFAWLIRLHR